MVRITPAMPGKVSVDGIAHESEQDDQVQDEGQVGVNAGAVVVDEHKDQTATMPMRRHAHPGGWSRRRARGRRCSPPGNGCDAGNEPVSSSMGQITGLLLGHGSAADFALIANLPFDVGDFLNLVVEHHS